MKLRFVQSGGFAGLLRGVELDTASLPPKLGKLAEQLLQRAGDLPSVASSASRDACSYSLSVEGPDGPKDVQFSDATLPDKFASLIEHLAAASKPLPRK
jgi:hypothetical protein